jgi:hypothetical protein
MARECHATLWRVIKKNRDSYFNYATPKKVWFIYLEMAVRSKTYKSKLILHSHIQAYMQSRNSVISRP